ncbi:MAG: hypothetical protein A2051_11505 [Desulfovibrionales bacterium GWA2_65_9]|nr:MAG: hypothetical protein A2051_11505 [Desulfovibrionales bacterium GWA2_65_9]
MLLAVALLFMFPSDISAQEIKKSHLVVQQNGQALVTELRPLTLPKGEGSVLLPGLPSTLDPQTLQVRSKTAPQGLAIHDLALDDDLLTPSNLLRRNLGKKVTLILPDGKTRDGRIQKEATILSTDEAPVFLIDGAIYAGPYEAILYPELPKGLSPRPRLTMNVNNSGPARQDIELTYIARELSWRMDYVLAMNKAATSGKLTGWVTLQNRSGADFGDAVVELLAGDPRSATQFTPRALFAAKAMAAPEAMDAVSAPQELFEYHLYPLKRPLTLANQQSRQVQLFESGRLGVSRKLLGRANALPSGREAEPIKENLDAVISFRNTKALGLGLPLPKGTLRAFQEQAESKYFLGEAPLERTPVGGSVELRLGQVFDITVERVALEFEKTGKNSYKGSWELRLRNSKKEAQRVVLQELLPGKWKVQDASQKWSKPSSGVLEFAVDVPAGTGQEPHLVRYSFSTEL